MCGWSKWSERASEETEWKERTTEVSKRMRRLDRASRNKNCNRTRDDQDDDVS